MTLLCPAQNHKFFHKDKELSRWKEVEGRDYQPATCGFRFGPLVCPLWAAEVRGKKFPSLVIFQIGISIFVFELFIKKNSKFWPISYSLKSIFSEWTNTMGFY